MLYPLKRPTEFCWPFLLTSAVTRWTLEEVMRELFPHESPLGNRGRFTFVRLLLFAPSGHIHDKTPKLWEHYC